jgi:hypothetical protein
MFYAIEEERRIYVVVICDMKESKFINRARTYSKEFEKFSA